ncbi:hypothetical protein [Acetobacter thailandicus]|uniref:hypothetical protein n=1 Tax=Acetobacter thailandicus TaxID=1502842 RepID=UPI001BA58EAD|nr:hypothetical protein [Acetobacter thailandicus]MBS0959512.1 hypothetical protein [Acetobacter thailandicus]
MSDVFLLSERQMERVESFFSLAHGVPRVATRYDRCAHTFMSAIHIIATVIFFCLKECVLSLSIYWRDICKDGADIKKAGKISGLQYFQRSLNGTNALGAAPV